MLTHSHCWRSEQAAVRWLPQWFPVVLHVGEEHEACQLAAFPDLLPLNFSPHHATPFLLALFVLPSVLQVRAKTLREG